MSSPQSFKLEAIVDQLDQSESRWLEFLRAPALSMGVYKLNAGDVDPQTPHGEDEIYYVVSGSGRFIAGAEVREARPGDLLYVPRGLEHRFLEITSDLTLLVFFAPAEGSTPSHPVI